MQLVAWMAATFSIFDARPVPPDPALRPVVLVHGIHSDGNCMRRLEKYLRAQGRVVHAPSLRPCTGGVPIEKLAEQLAFYVDRNVPDRKFDLVGFSMGGLVTRYYIQRLGGIKRVENFITMATPHQGTKLAHLHPGPGVAQMRPGSPFLLDLQSDADVLRKVKFTSFYTPLDTVIVPATNSTVPQARNVRMIAAIHPSFLLEKRCLRAIASELGHRNEKVAASAPARKRAMAR